MSQGELEGSAHPQDVRVVVRGGAIQIAGQITQGMVAFVFVAVIVRLLNTAEYGLFRQVAQILAIGGQLGLAGFNFAALRHIAQARASDNPGSVRGSARAAAIGALVSSALVFVVLQVSAYEIAGSFAEDDLSRRELAGLIRLGAGFVPLFALTQVFRYCTQAYKTMVPSVIVGNIVQPIVRLVVATGLIVIGFGVRGAVLGMMLAAAVALALSLTMFRRILTSVERRTPATSRPAPMVRFALLQGGSSLLGIQTLGLGVLILGAYGTDRDVGLLGIAFALQTPGTLFLGGVVNIWAPVVTDLYERRQIARLEALYRAITRWVVTFSLPIFAALIFLPDLFVDLLAGHRGLGAAPLVAILAVGNLFYSGTGPTGFVLSMTGRPGINFLNSAVGVALYIGLGIWIVPAHGAVGMAVVDASVTAIINIVRVVEAKVVVGIHPFGRSLLKPVAATAIALGLTSTFVSLFGTGTTSAIAALTLSALAYVAVLNRLGLDPEERQVWESVLRRMRHLKPALGGTPPSAGGTR